MLWTQRCSAQFFNLDSITGVHKFLAPFFSFAPLALLPSAAFAFTNLLPSYCCALHRYLLIGSITFLSFHRAPFLAAPPPSFHRPHRFAPPSSFHRPHRFAPPPSFHRPHRFAVPPSFHQPHHSTLPSRAPLLAFISLRRHLSISLITFTTVFPLAQSYHGLAFKSLCQCLSISFITLVVPSSSPWLHSSGFPSASSCPLPYHHITTNIFQS